MVSIKGNQVEVIPAEGGRTQTVHITDVKYVLPADSIIKHLPDFNTFGRKTNLTLDPSKVIDLHWQIATTLNTKTTDTLTFTSANASTNTTNIYTQPQITQIK